MSSHERKRSSRRWMPWTEVTSGAGRAANGDPTRPQGGKETSSSDRRTLLGAGLAGVAGSLLASAPARADGAGPLASATISFGGWMLPLDRFPNLSPRTANHHALCPDHVTVKSGGCVNFVIAGLHHILIYDDGTRPEDIDTSLLIPPTFPPPPALINDPNRRIYRGLDPTTVPQERVEVVHFEQPGTYLVICGVPPHFADGMFGFIRVLP